MFEIPLWLVWVTVAVVLVLTDIYLLGLQFILVATGLAALVSACASVLGIGITGQLWTFIVSLIVFTSVWVYLYRKKAFTKKAGPREKGWEKGREIKVVRQGDRVVGKLQGDTYPVKLADGSLPQEGEILIVDKMEGITLWCHREKST